MNKILTFVVVIAMAIVTGLILSLPAMWLWNACLVPAVAGLNKIEWLQAWGILVLCNMLFKTRVSTK